MSNAETIEQWLPKSSHNHDHYSEDKSVKLETQLVVDNHSKQISFKCAINQLITNGIVTNLSHLPWQLKCLTDSEQITH